MKKRQILFALIVLLIVFPTDSFSQTRTMYGMKHVPQHNYFNPARQLECKVYIGFPALSSINPNLITTGFTYDDIFSPKGADPDSFIIDLDKLVASMDNSNILSLENHISLIEFGFALDGSQYITFSASNNTTQQFTYPNSILDLRGGNYREDGTPLTINFKEQFKNYNQYSIGYSKKFYNDLVIGARLNIYSGNAHFETNNFNVEWLTDTDQAALYPWTFNTDIDINAAAVVEWELETDESGMISGVEIDSDNINFTSLAFSKNIGLGLDVGADYRMFDWLNLSASVKDFGYIKWKTNAKSISNQGEFKFTGVDIGRYISGIGDLTAGVSVGDSLIRDLKDSLLLHFTPAVQQSDDYSYNDFLSSQFFASAEFYVNDWLDFGTLYHGILIDKKMYSSFSVSANANFMKGWAFSLNYSIANKANNNIGMGFAYKLGPVQMYFITDNISTGLYMWDKEFTKNYLYNTKSFNFHFGINILICKSKYDYGLMY